MNKQIRFIVDVAIFAGLGLVLDLFSEMYSSSIFPNGGSIGVAMVCIFIISFKYGIGGGVLTGFLIGIIQTLISIKTVGFNALTVFVQIAMDYWLAYTVVGIAGIFSNKFINSNNKKSKTKYLIFGVILGVFARLIIAGSAGWIFWTQYFPQEFLDKGTVGILVYTFGYNALYLIPSAILCIIVLLAVNAKVPKILSDKVIFEENDIVK